MRLLIDQNLPPRMARALAEHFPGSLHVRDIGLAAAPDEEIWDFATAHGYAIASKDSDFCDLSIVAGPPPKVVWVRRGNCSAQAIHVILEENVAALRAFLTDVEAALIALD